MWKQDKYRIPTTLRACLHCRVCESKSNSEVKSGRTTIVKFHKFCPHFSFFVICDPLQKTYGTILHLPLRLFNVVKCNLTKLTTKSCCVGPQLPRSAVVQRGVRSHQWLSLPMASLLKYSVERCQSIDMSDLKSI